MMNNITPELAEILGLLCAEGSHVISYTSYWSKDRGKNRYFRNDKSERIEFTNKDKQLLIHYQELLLKEFNYEPRITKHHKVNICKMPLIKAIINYTELGNLKWKVPTEIMEANFNIKIAFIRGYFDGDGTISNRIRMFSINKEGLEQVSKILNKIEIVHTLQKPIVKEARKPLYSIQISEKQRESFLKLIKPFSKRSGNMRG